MNGQSYANELLEVICEITEIKAMRVTVGSSAKSGLIVGAATALSAMVMGPRGIALGAVAAGIATACAMDRSFRSVPDVLRNDLTTEQKNQLAQRIKALFTQENISSVADFALKVFRDDQIVALVILVVKCFLEKIFKAKVA